MNKKHFLNKNRNLKFFGFKDFEQNLFESSEITKRFWFCDKPTPKEIYNTKISEKNDPYKKIFINNKKKLKEIDESNSPEAKKLVSNVNSILCKLNCENNLLESQEFEKEAFFYTN